MKGRRQGSAIVYGQEQNEERCPEQEFLITSLPQIFELRGYAWVIEELARYQAGKGIIKEQFLQKRFPLSRATRPPSLKSSQKAHRKVGCFLHAGLHHLDCKWDRLWVNPRSYVKICQDACILPGTFS